MTYMGKIKSEVGRRLTEMRHSSAAGKHGKKRKDRRNTKRKAIEEAKCH